MRTPLPRHCNLSGRASNQITPQPSQGADYHQLSRGTEMNLNCIAKALLSELTARNWQLCAGQS